MKMSALAVQGMAATAALTGWVRQVQAEASPVPDATRKKAPENRHRSGRMKMRMHALQNREPSLWIWGHSSAATATCNLPGNPERPTTGPRDKNRMIADRNSTFRSMKSYRHPLQPSAPVTQRKVKARRPSSTDPYFDKQTGSHPNCKLQLNSPRVRHRAIGSPRHRERQTV